jgi:hypothetical protein
LPTPGAIGWLRVGLQIEEPSAIQDLCPIEVQATDTVGESTLEADPLDAVDPEAAPGVGTPVRGGLTYREAHLLMELVNEAGIVSSLDVVEINPILDIKNGTAALAVELVESLMGRTIIDLPR